MAEEGTLVANLTNLLARADTIVNAQRAAVGAMPNGTDDEKKAEAEANSLIGQIGKITDQLSDVEGKTTSSFQEMRQNYGDIQTLLGGENPDLGKVMELVTSMEAAVKQRQGTTKLVDRLAKDLRKRENSLLRLLGKRGKVRGLWGARP